MVDAKHQRAVLLQTESLFDGPADLRFRDPAPPSSAAASGPGVFVAPGYVDCGAPATRGWGYRVARTSRAVSRRRSRPDARLARPAGLDGPHALAARPHGLVRSAALYSGGGRAGSTSLRFENEPGIAAYHHGATAGDGLLLPPVPAAHMVYGMVLERELRPCVPGGGPLQSRVRRPHHRNQLALRCRTELLPHHFGAGESRTYRIGTPHPAGTIAVRALSRRRSGLPRERRAQGGLPRRVKRRPGGHPSRTGERSLILAWRVE